jgi:hypothetical protein
MPEDMRRQAVNRKKKSPAKVGFQLDEKEMY